MRDCLAEILDAQPGTGAAFAAWYDGRRVVDLWGGYADSGRRRPWDARSLVQPYSVSKPFAAVCALRLVAAGRLELDAPMQRYWPEFRAGAGLRDRRRRLRDGRDGRKLRGDLHLRRLHDRIRDRPCREP